MQKEIDSINKLISEEYSAKATILVSNPFQTLDGHKLKYRQDFEYSQTCFYEILGKELKKKKKEIKEKAIVVRNDGKVLEEKEKNIARREQELLLLEKKIASKKKSHEEEVSGNVGLVFK